MPLRNILSRLLGVSSAKAPEGELIAGVLHPGGAGGSRVPPATEWTLRFTLEEWRGADGIIRATPLSIHRILPQEEMRALMDRINATRIVTARVRFDGEGSAELLELLDARVPPGDPLALRAIELARPVTHESERFGTLRLNRSVEWWEGDAMWAGDSIRVVLSAQGEAELAAALAVADALWDDEAGWNERVQAFAVESLLALKNESWLDEDEDGVTEMVFRAAMQLESITIYPDGSWEFWHDDGDLFWGHSILVSGTLAEGPNDADIPG